MHVNVWVRKTACVDMLTVEARGHLQCCSPGTIHWEYLYLCVLIVLPHLCVCTTCVPDVRGGQKRALDSLVLKLETVVNHQVSAEK